MTFLLKAQSSWQDAVNHTILGESSLLGIHTYQFVITQAVTAVQFPYSSNNVQ